MKSVIGDHSLIYLYLLVCVGACMSSYYIYEDLHMYSRYIPLHKLQYVRVNIT
jgi:hypothetical protein